MLEGDFGYARVSSDEQAQGHSIDSQVARLEAAGCRYVFRDVESAYKRDSYRPDFERMVQLVVSGQVKGRCLVVTNLDRLARNEVTAFTLFDELEAAGVRLISLDQAYIDLSHPDGRVMAGYSVLEARAYSARLSRRVKQGHQHHRNRNAAYFAPFGYMKVGDRLELDHAPFLCLLEDGSEWSRAAIGRDLVEIFMVRRSLRKSLRTVNEKYGIASFSGKGKGNKQARGRFHFHLSGFGSWLNNPILRGHLAYGRSYRQRQSHQHLWDVRYNVHPNHRLMSDEEYRQVEEVLNHNAERGGFSFVSELIHPLSGLIYCGECGGKCRITHFRLRTDPSVKTYSYQCNTYHLKACAQKPSVRESVLEQAIIEALMSRAEAIASLASVAADVVEPPELQALRAELLFYEGAPGQRAEGIKADLRQQIQAYQCRLQEADVARAGNLGLLLEVFGDRSYWKTLQDEDKRDIYRVLVDRVRMRNGRVEGVELRV